MARTARRRCAYAGCKQPLSPNARKDAQYCSDVCRWRDRNLLAEAVRNQSQFLVCLQCNDRIRYGSRSHAVYCSVKCRVAAHREHWQEEAEKQRLADKIEKEYWEVINEYGGKAVRNVMLRRYPHMTWDEIDAALLRAALPPRKGNVPLRLMPPKPGSIRTGPFRITHPRASYWPIC
jgi:hypothetical protein